MRTAPLEARFAAWLAVLAGTAAGTGASLASAAPRVASINLCTDQLVLRVAAPAQIATVSWLAADPEESVLAEQAAAYPLNYGTAEEILRYRPDVVLAGSFTGTAAVRLLKRQGLRVVTIEPATHPADIAQNLRRVGEAVGRPAVGDRIAAEVEARVAAGVESGGAAASPGASSAPSRAARSSSPQRTVVVRPGGFTVGTGSLADALLELAGLDNVAARQGLDRWGSLSVETLLRSRPELVVVTDYRSGEASLANAFLAHPALRSAIEQVPIVTVPARYWACGLPESLDTIEMLRAAAPPPKAR